MIDLNSLFKKLISIATNTLTYYYVGELEPYGFDEYKSIVQLPPENRSQRKITYERTEFHEDILSMKEKAI
jgi:hypothetical protein